MTTKTAVSNVIRTFNEEVGAFNNEEAEVFVRQVMDFAQQVVQEVQKRLDILNAAKNSAVPSFESAIIPELDAAPWPPNRVWLPDSVVMLAAVSPELENVEGAFWVREQPLANGVTSDESEENNE